MKRPSKSKTIFFFHRSTAFYDAIPHGTTYGLSRQSHKKMNCTAVIHITIETSLPLSGNSRRREHIYKEEN